MYFNYYHSMLFLVKTIGSFKLFILFQVVRCGLLNESYLFFCWTDCNQRGLSFFISYLVTQYHFAKKNINKSKDSERMNALQIKQLSLSEWVVKNSAYSFACFQSWTFVHNTKIKSLICIIKYSKICWSAFNYFS